MRGDSIWMVGLAVIVASAAAIGSEAGGGSNLVASLDGWNGINRWQRDAEILPSAKGPGGRACMRITVKDVQWALLDKVLIFPENVSRVVFEGSIMAENVQKGQNSIDMARAIIQFLGATAIWWVIGPPGPEPLERPTGFPSGTSMRLHPGRGLSRSCSASISPRGSCMRRALS